MSKPLVYLACPYSSKAPTKEEQLVEKTTRFELSNEAASELMGQGLSVFAPISMAHPIAIQCGLPGDWKFWEKFDTDFISCCSALYVLCIDGYKESTGVNAEIKIAKDFGIPIIYLEYDPNSPVGNRLKEIDRS